MPRIVPESWMPECSMRRIILHWTAGGHRANTIDREHYHLLIEGDGRILRGDHSIADNVRTGDDDYAAHTLNCNGRAVGVAACCMRESMERPFRPGPSPMTLTQYEVMAVVTADLCEKYRIGVSRETVLGHGEVQEILNIRQRQKWDPMVLPWDPGTPRREVGDAFRARVKALLERKETPNDPAPGSLEDLRPVAVTLDGTPLANPGFLKADQVWCPLRRLSDALNWTVLDIDSDSAVLQTSEGIREVLATIRGDRGYVLLRDLREKMDWRAPDWDGTTRTLNITPRP
jgi:hypothetical protein